MPETNQKKCKYCQFVQKKTSTKYCEVCGQDEFIYLDTDGNPLIEKTKAEKIDEYKEDAKNSVFVTVLPSVPGREILEDLGLIYGTSSKMALGLNTQAARIELAMDAAMTELKVRAKLKGANAVVAISFALNSSQGSSAAFMGSSEGVVVMGSAVKAS